MMETSSSLNVTISKMFTYIFDRLNVTLFSSLTRVHECVALTNALRRTMINCIKASCER